MGDTHTAARAAVGKRGGGGQAQRDAGTGVRNKKMVLVYQDTYMLGKGFMGATSVEVPEKYYSVNK